jgi:hypothetical protein
MVLADIYNVIFQLGFTFCTSKRVIKYAVTAGNKIKLIKSNSTCRTRPNRMTSIIRKMRVHDKSDSHCKRNNKQE